MANNILIENTINSLIGITLNGLASGSARQSDLIDNTTSMSPAAHIFLGIESNGSAPTLGATYEVYLLRATDFGSSPAYVTDGGGKLDAAITILNATLIGTIRVTASANTVFYGDFDTSPAGPLGPVWGIAIKNASGQALHATTAKAVAYYNLYHPQVQ